MGASREDFVKYPRTPHLFGSRGTDDDKHLSAADSAQFIADTSLIVEEKLDGTNVGIHFTSAGRIVLQCRGHEITSQLRGVARGDAAQTVARGTQPGYNRRDMFSHPSMTSRGKRLAGIIAVLILFFLPKHVECGYPDGRCGTSGMFHQVCKSYEVEPLGLFAIEKLTHQNVGFAYARGETCR